MAVGKSSSGKSSPKKFTKKSGPKMGRPRSFDTEKALDRAMQVFWKKGYEGTSLSDLTRAMGINRPSLYAAFGDKESLFRKVLDRYEQGPASYLGEALKRKTAREVVEDLLRKTADQLTCPRQPHGCLLIQGALACGAEGERARKELVARRTANEKELQARLEQAKAEGDLPPDTDPAALAHFVVTVIRGMGVEAAGGATRAELEQVIQFAMRAWPD